MHSPPLPARLMRMFRLTSRCLALLIAIAVSTPLFAAETPQADLITYRDTVAPLFKQYCTDCHGPDLQEAKLDLTAVDADLLGGDKLETWRIIEEQLRFGDMPPQDETQPTAGERAAMLKWIRGEMLKLQRGGTAPDEKLSLPQYGNYVDHDALFNEPAGPVIPAPPGLWRMRPEIYNDFARRVSDSSSGRSQPFTVTPVEDIKDFSAIYYIDEPSTDLLLRNAQLMIDQQQTNRWRFKEQKAILDEKSPPTEEQITKAIRSQFDLALRRAPTDDELQRFLKLYETTTKTGGHVIGGKAMLMAIVMLPEAVFRLELGQGPIDELGRQRLSQHEIAVAIGYALGNRVNDKSESAAEKGELATREQIAAEVRRILDDPQGDTSRIMQFFREYFGYEQAVDVFKDPPEVGRYEPKVLVSDLEFLIQDIVAADQDVLYELLTTNRAYVNYSYDRKRSKASPNYNKKEYETVYGLPADWKWTDKQPIALPKDERAGVLTHPAWLAAWSGNFDNHPVQRGKWIRTHLLGGSVPDVPIGVDARVPEDEHRTFRARLSSATSKAECWRCHRKMDPLGLPFEQFTHYGYRRRLELDKPVDASGAITRTGDPKLDAEVKDPIELVHRLARSERAEQVFIRYAFRFFLGRNETLGDARTLQDAHRAYRENDGSFEAVIVSLLSSDSFNYRM